jgi:hypothetical protein
VNGTVHGLVAALSFAADEDEHLYPSLVLVDKDFTDVFTCAEDDPELKASGFALAAAETAARTPNVDQLGQRSIAWAHQAMLPPPCWDNEPATVKLLQSRRGRLSVLRMSQVWAR